MDEVEVEVEVKVEVAVRDAIVRDWKFPTMDEINATHSE